MKITTTQKGENFTHKWLWNVVKRQVESAKAKPQGSHFDDLSAMVFALYSFEAYLNYLGSRLAPEIWRDERNFFRREPYRGFDGRVRKVFELCKLKEPNRDTRPYKTVWSLKDLRDFIGHGRTKGFSRTYVHLADAGPPFFLGPFDSMVSHDKAIEAKEDIHIVACSLHQEAKGIIINNIYFGDDPFEGIQGYATEISGSS